jgi:hypothetical protein
MAAGEEVCGFAQRAAELAEQAANVSRAVNSLLWQQGGSRSGGGGGGGGGGLQSRRRISLAL